MTPLSEAQIMADAIPDATLVRLEGGSHYAAVEFPDLMNQHLGRFWMSRVQWTPRVVSA